MEGSLANRTVLVTGAAHRVGRAIAEGCARAGANVAVHYRRSESQAHQVVDYIKGLGRRSAAFGADLTDPGAARSLVADAVRFLGGLDVLVNNAASFVQVPFCDSDEERWERAWVDSLQTNLVAPARLARLAAKPLRRCRGVIVNIVDVGAQLAWPGYAHHTAAKAGLAHLTRTLAIALAPDIRVVGVAPGIAEFPASYTQEQRNKLIAKTALGRPGSAVDIAQAVVFLACQDYTTGVILPVDGGWSIPR